MYKFFSKNYLLIHNWYTKNRLNLGIKKWLHSFAFPNFFKASDYLDNLIVFPVYNFLKFYLSLKLGYHYGASYRNWNYRSHNLDYERSNLGYGLIHESIVRNLRPKRILCVGSMYGFIPFICANACRENGQGIVDFVDAGYDEHNPADKDRHSFGLGFWRKNNPKKHFSYLKADKYINTYVMTTLEFSKKYPNRKYDYIYIDGDHTYKGVKLDYKLFWKRLKKGGLMGFHDTDTVGMYGNLYFDVDRFLKETIYKTKTYLHFPNESSGLVIAQKL